MRILVVEDEKRIADSIKKGLIQEHHTVDVAYNGTDGFDLASSEKYDLLILDLMLPGIDGLSICRELRNKEVLTPILILTAKSLTQDKVAGLDLGADDYLTKPFDFEELLARVRALTRRPRLTLSTVYTLNDLTLNSQTFEVYRSDKLLHLSSKEFALLSYMIRYPNTILTKDQIIQNVWSFDDEILPNTVEVYIRNLRQKIDLPFPSLKPLIHTVRGFGYRLGDSHV